MDFAVHMTGNPTQRPRLTPRIAVAARFAALGGVAAGLSASAYLDGAPGALPVAVVALIALLATAPRSTSRLAAPAWLALVAAAALSAGLGLGSAAPAGDRRRCPRPRSGEPRPGPRLRRGRPAPCRRRSCKSASTPPMDASWSRRPSRSPTSRSAPRSRRPGRSGRPRQFEREYLARLGIRRILQSREIQTRPQRRGGLTGLLDRVRARAQEALSTGTPPASAALLRGFVLGQDDRIDAATIDEFKRSGLAHLLAVSGQNVVLLAMLAAGAARARRDLDPRPPARDRRPDRRLRVRHRRRPVDPARGGDGRRRDRRRARRPTAIALVRARCSPPRSRSGSTRARLATSAGSSASPPSRASCSSAPRSRRSSRARGRRAGGERSPRRPR